MDLMEGVGESSSPPRCFGTFSCSSNNYDMRNDVYNRLMETANEEAISNPDFRELLDAHFNRLPPSYTLDINLDKVEDVLLHQKILARAKDPAEKRPVFHIRSIENISSRVDDDDDDDDDDGDGIILKNVSSTPKSCHETDNKDGQLGSVHKRLRDTAVHFEPCSKLEDLNLNVRNNDMEDRHASEKLSKSQEDVHIHEVIFSTVDKPKLLSQLSALLSDIGLNIREAHVFSTTDGYSLDVFVVDGWPVKETDDLFKAMEQAVARSEGSWSGTSHSDSAVEKTLAMEAKSGDGEIDRRLLKIGERIASGSCGDLHRGVYLGQDVAVKILRSEHLNAALEVEFTQEVAILREVQHTNVVRFIGACTKAPHLCIVTEYMPGGSLYDYLQKNSKTILKVYELIKYAIDVCKGMEYLHQNQIIHRDLKTANLLMDTNKVVKVADFGVARFQDQNGVMTAETGTYRWMAPEVINHQPYDQKADVFSFAIVLWELVTAKVPYDTMTPLQAALGVRQGLRPEVPKNANPKLVDIMQRCWEADPTKRPSFSEITLELESFLREIQET